MTDNKKKCHYIVQKNTVRVANYFFLFFVHLIKNATYFSLISSNLIRKLLAIAGIFLIFSSFTLSNGIFIGLSVIFAEFRHQNRQNDDHYDADDPARSYREGE